MQEREYKNAQAKIFLTLVLAVAVGFSFLEDKDFPRWWSEGLSVLAGAAALGLCFWLSSAIDNWLRRE